MLVCLLAFSLASMRHTHLNETDAVNPCFHAPHAARGPLSSYHIIMLSRRSAHAAGMVVVGVEVVGKVGGGNTGMGIWVVVLHFC